MSLLDDILAGVEETYGGQNATEKQPNKGSASASTPQTSSSSQPMQSFQEHLRRRAQQQAKRFRQKIQKMMEKFKASSDESTQFTNETEEQRRYIIHEVAADLGFFSRDEDPSEGGGSVKSIAVYKETPDEKTLSYEDLSQFQKAEMSRQMALEKRKGKKKKQAEMEKKIEKRLRDPRAIATRLIAHRPRDKRSMLEIQRDVRRQKKLQKEAKLKEIAAKAAGGVSAQEIVAEKE
mmetsp:Transcript_28726/g.40066  ORF Transcript_28726/g.40066 Transcript_28726/m.40066 type:complete len:235 (-) Transcript_28726:114-818(-)|eukprot:CAMPEP_0185256278 /NCGR_PEP_ID=MMETSP1359-20130426/5354_1 /TAXON_ID=552665 /ORGANISM="Bigelowiella longifila, Strain CCMP242" /LENGTH=234 /DNA_ID=CAMNT_0027840731 /DNA_START=57 /DNA_END=761 /DNA_ORIENTATION=+